MMVTDITLAAFTFCNSARVVAYVAQFQGDRRPGRRASHLVRDLVSQRRWWLAYGRCGGDHRLAKKGSPPCSKHVLVHLEVRLRLNHWCLQFMRDVPRASRALDDARTYIPTASHAEECFRSRAQGEIRYDIP
jgi:hypothetical protein